MAFIGNTVENQGFTPAIDYFNGNGVTVTFTLSRPVASVAQMIVAIDNVIQNPSSAFTVSGNAITFTSAPLSGTNNIWVEYTSLITTYAGISQDPSVIGDITATGGYLAEGDFGNTYIDGTIVDYVTGNGRITAGSGDGITLYTGGTAARTALTTFTSAGNVGIATSNPQSYLHIAATSGLTPQIKLGGTSSYQLQVGYNNSAEYGFLQAYAVNLSTPDDIVINPSGGNLLVGTTTNFGAGGISISPSATAPTVDVKGSATTNGSSVFNVYSTGATAYRFYVGMAGTIYATSTTITSLSDQRLKENIVDLDDGLNAVMALKPRKFDWKAGKGKDVKGDRGFIAQELETVFPDMIEESKDPVPEGEEPYKAVSANLIPTLVKAIQELNAKVTALEAKLEAK